MTLFRSRDVISCNVTATSSELQPCRSANVPKTWLTGLVQPLPGDFRSNDVTSGLLPVKWVHVTFPVTWQPPRASYSPVGAQTYPKLALPTFYSHFQVTSGQMTSLPDHFRSRELKWRHFLSRDCHLLQVIAL